MGCNEESGRSRSGLDAVKIVALKVVLIGVDLAVHLDLDELGLLPGHVDILEGVSRGVKNIGRSSLRDPFDRSDPIDFGRTSAENSPRLGSLVRAA